MASAALELLIQLKDEASAGLSAIGGGLNAIGVVAGGAVVAGLGAAAAAAFSFASDSAQNVANFQAQLGATASEAEALGAVAEQVFAANWYDSVSQAGEAVAMVQQQLGDLGTEGLAQVTNGVAAMSSTFNVEGEAIVNAVRAIRDNFPGTTEAEALDMITVGFQQGLNSSGDFLDSITEYSTQFGNGGASASQFFSVMETGLGTGMLGTDKAADMFKEFVVRIQDGSTLTSESLSMLGLNADKILTDLANGTIKPVDAFNMVQDALAKTDDQAVIMQAGVGLLGTQFEDLGASAAIGTSTMSSTFQNVGGAVDGLNVKFNSIGDVVEGMKRQALVAIAPIGEGLLALANGAMPTVQSGFGALTSVISSGVGAVMTFASALGGNAEAFNNLSPAIQTAVTVLQTIGGVFMDLANQALAWGANIFNQVAAGMMSAAGPIVDAISSIGSVIAGLLMPGSPPAFLPELDQWGAGAMSAYMEGWGQGDFSVFNSITDTIKGALDGIAKASGDKGMNIAGILLGSQDEIARAVDEVRQFGSVSEATFNSIIEAAGPAGPQIAGLVDAYLDLQAATQEVAAAQQELNDITASYAAQLDPLNAQLKGIQSQKQAIQDQQRLAKLYEEAGVAAEGSTEKQLKLLEIQELETKMKIRATEQERDVAVSASKEKLDAAKQEQAQAKARVDQQKAMIDQQNKTNALIADQAKAMTAVGGAVKAAGGAMAGAAAATKPLADAVQGVNQTIGAVRQNVDTARAALASMGATVTSVVAPPMEWLRGAITGLMGAAAGIGVVLGAPAVWTALGAALSVAGTALAAIGTAVAFVVSPLGLLLIAAGALGAAITTNFMGIGTLAQNLMAIFGQFGTVVSQAFAAFQSGGLTAALSTFGAGLAGIGAQLLAWAGQAGMVLLQIGQAFVAWVTPLIPVVLAQLAAWGGAIVSWIVTQGPILLTQFLTWGQSLIGWIAPYIPMALTALGELIVSIGAWVVEQAPILIAQLLAWGQALIDWVAPYIPLALAALGELITSLLGWIGEQVGPLLDAFGAWAASIAGWVPGAIVSFLAEWPAMLSGWLDMFASWVGPLLAQLAALGAQLIGWVATQAGPLLAQLAIWGVQFVAWVLPMIPRVLAALAGIAVAIGAFIVETAGVLVVKVAQWGLAFLGWVGTSVLPKLPGVLVSILTAIGGWISGAIGKLSSEAAKIGQAVVDGIKQGLSNGWGKVMSWLAEKVASIPEPIRKIMGIASPSKVMAQEVGAPIVDGIVAGLVQRSPKAVQAMLDLASSMFEVVNKGVEAFGKLTQLGSIPQSAITNFSDAIQRTLTEFSQRVGQWDKAAMSAASQFTFKAGQVVDFLAKGVELLNGIAALAVPSQNAIRAFADSLAMVMSEIVRVSTFELRLGLTAGVEFASGAKAIAEMIAKGVEALNALSDFVRPAPGVIQQFADVMYWLVSRFVLVGGWFDGQALGAATAFAAAADTIFKVVAGGVDAMLKLAEFVRPAPGVIGTFVDVLAWLISRFVLVGQWFNGPALAAGTAFAEAAGKVVGVVSAAVDGLLKLAEFVRPAPGVIQEFTNVVWWLVSRFAEAATWMSSKALAAAVAFAEGAGKAVGVIGGAVDALGKLSTFVAPLEENVSAFFRSLADFLEKMGSWSANFEADMLEATGIFAAGIQKSVAGIGAAADALGKLVDFVAPAEANVSAFFRSLADLLEKMGVWAANFEADMLEATGIFAAGIQKSVAGIGAAADALGKLVDFVAPAEKNVSAFFRSLADLLEKMGVWSANFEADMLEATAVFAAGINQAVAPLKGAIESLAKFTDFVPPAQKGISAFFQSVGALLTQMGQLAGQYSAEFFAGTILFGQNVSKAVAIVKASFDQFAGLADLKGLAAGVLTNFSNNLARLLDELGALVAPAAENIGAALVYGIADGITAQLPYLVATLQNAAYTMVDTVNSALGIASPSKVFEQIGQYAGEGMAGGMEAMQPAIAGAGAGLGMSAVGGTGAAMSGGGGGGGAGPGSGGLTINIGSGAIVLNGVQGGIGEKELRRLAQLLKEEIANERGTR